MDLAVGGAGYGGNVTGGVRGWTAGGATGAAKCGVEGGAYTRDCVNGIRGSGSIPFVAGGDLVG